ncbi:MAG: oligosaccharide flippase family protein, partial [Lachnospiraceae bacterium]|nr:oligosaccharide flippase family protein [Candidatus Equihabitans merdae]
MLLSLIATPIITRVVDPLEYGQLSIFTMYADIAVMVLCLGLDQAMVRDFYKHDNDEYRQTLLWKCVLLPVVLTVVIGIVVVATSALGLIHFEFNTLIMGLLCLYVLLMLIQRFSVLLVRLRYQSKLFSIISITQKAAYLVCALVLVFLIKDHYLVLLVISLVIAISSALVLGICAQKKIWRLDRRDAYDNEVSFGNLFTYGWPFIISLGITQLFNAADKIALDHFTDYHEVGVYASALNMVAIFGIVQSTFNNLWAPMAVEHYENDPEDRSFYKTGNAYITIVMFAMGICLILGKDIFALLLGSKYREAAYILPFLIFHPIMYTISETTVSGIVFMKKSKMQVVIGAISCAVNMTGNAILVPMIGGKGAAISTG